METKKLRIGRIPYLVGAPFYQCLPQREEYVFCDGHPKELNELLHRGEIDLAPSSSIEYGQHSSDYVLFPHIGTAGDGQIGSVLLFSELPLERLKDKELFLTPASETSVALTRLLLKKYLKVNVVEVENPTPKVSAKLFIGNEAMLEKEQGNWPYCFDLAELWKKETGLPFVFGLWIVRKEVLESSGNLLQEFAFDLKNSVEQFYGALEDNLGRWEVRYPSHLPHGVKMEYFKKLEYKLEAKHIRGLKRFFDDCADNGLIGGKPPLRFLDLEEAL